MERDVKLGCQCKYYNRYTIIDRWLQESYANQTACLLWAYDLCVIVYDCETSITALAPSVYLGKHEIIWLDPTNTSGHRQKMFSVNPNKWLSKEEFCSVAVASVSCLLTDVKWKYFCNNLNLHAWAGVGFRESFSRHHKYISGYMLTCRKVLTVKSFCS